MPKMSLAPPFSSYIGRDATRSSDIGQVLYRLQNRQIVRNFTRPSNPRSEDQQASRILLAAASGAWNTLTDPQQADWIALGALVTRIDAGGNTYHLSGKAVYVESFCNLAQAGGAPGATPNAFESPPTITSLTSVAHLAGPARLVFTFVTPATDGGATFWISGPLGPGTRKVQPTFIRLAADAPDAFQDFSTSNTTFTLLDADARRVVTTGDKIGVRIRPMDAGNALRGIDLEQIVTVA